MYRCWGGRIRELMEQITKFDKSPSFKLSNFIIKRVCLVKGYWSKIYFDYQIDTDNWKIYCLDADGRLKALINDLKWYIETRK